MRFRFNVIQANIIDIGYEVPFEMYDIQLEQEKKVSEAKIDDSNPIVRIYFYSQYISYTSKRVHVQGHSDAVFPMKRVNDHLVFLDINIKKIPNKQIKFTYQTNKGWVKTATIEKAVLKTQVMAYYFEHKKTNVEETMSTIGKIFGWFTGGGTSSKTTHINQNKCGEFILNHLIQDCINYQTYLKSRQFLKDLYQIAQIKADTRIYHHIINKIEKVATVVDV